MTMMKTALFWFAIPVATLLAQNTALERDALTILRQNCAGCHGATVAQGKLRLDSPESIARGGMSGPALVPGHSADSAIVQRVRSTENSMRMPPAVAPLAPEKIAVLAQWIDAGAPGLPSAAAAVDFERDVEPVLKSKCFGCHAGAQAKAQLRLDAASTAMKGGLSGPVIVAGKSDESRLIHRIEGKGNEKQMPLGGTPLTPEQIATVRKWIDSGAKWPESKLRAEASIEKHWAYRKPVKAPLPAVKQSDRVRNPIDAFLLARLEKQGLAFSQEASRQMLIRRLSLDLTGLPPTPEDVDAFVNDTSAGAYERVVDRLMASPRYGERWARPWLDMARYADTNGFEKDLRRTMWRYRDWVINALNRDMPFDQFTIEQLAGDLLPNATVEQKIATGFHRNTMFNEEGGVDKDEARFEILVDRVNTTGAVWLASTWTCTQCHNHKYDPFTQKEYYQVMAFFNSGKKSAKEYGDTSTKWDEPVLDLPTPEQEQKRAELDSRIKSLEEKLKTHTPELEAAQRAWEKRVLQSSKDWTTLVPSKAESSSGAKLEPQQAGLILVTGENPLSETYTLEAAAKLKRFTGLRLETVPHDSLPRRGPGRDAYGNFILSEVVLEAASRKTPNDWQKIELTRSTADDGRVNQRGRLWSIDASREDVRPPRQLVLMAKSPVALKGDTLFRVRIRSTSELSGQSIGQFRLSVTGADDPSTIVKVRHALRAALESESRTEEQKKSLAAYYRGIAPLLDEARDELKEARNRKDKLGIATALVMEEDSSNQQRPSDFIRTRGGFANKAEQVWADTPAALNPMTPDMPKNRLGLARWIVSKDNPLTARVAVNRMWEQYFGRGIVETSEDFGAQGERPNHPELLDWLAVEFMDRGWSMKAIHRLIVTSSAYRQTSHTTPEILQTDPYNRLISRGPRFRMEAEMLRDSALASSGLLSSKIGGPSVFPPQPPGVWDLPYNDDQWEESKGEDRYRRGLYTFVRRSAMYPAMTNFDATSREVCTVKRVRTNTPLQALTTLNDEAYFEAARALARRVMTGAQKDADRVALAFRLVSARTPSSSELDRVLTWQGRERTYFEQHPDEARKITGAGAAANANAVDTATWTMFANVLLNSDEALTKE